MTPSEYIENCMVTASPGKNANVNVDMNLLHGALGIVTEAGEFLDQIKKNTFYGKEIDYVNLGEEVGDMLWYISVILNSLGLTYEEVMDKNIAKLRARYGDKFTKEKAINRDLKTERDILES